MSEITSRIRDDVKDAIREAMKRDYRFVDPDVLFNALVAKGYVITPPERKVTLNLTMSQARCLFRGISMAQATIPPMPPEDIYTLSDIYGLLMNAVGEDDGTARSR